MMDSGDAYKIEPGTQEDIEVLTLLKIPGFGANGQGEIEEENINDELFALADKEAMDNLVQELMSQNQQFIIEEGTQTRQFDFHLNDPIFTV